MMRRVLYVAESLMAGGIESQLVELVTRLDRTRYQPYVLCLYGARAGRSPHFAPQLRAASVPFTCLDLGWSAADKARALRHIIQAVWTIRPHIVQAEGYHANLLARLARPWLPLSIRLIGTARGAETAKQLLYQRLSYRLCACLVASGPHLKAALTHTAGVPENRVLVIPNAIDTQRFAVPHDPDLRARIASGARRVFVSLGRISRQKSMHVTVQALGLLKRQNRLPEDVRVFIVGPVEEPRMQALLDEAIRRDDLSATVIQQGATAFPEDFYHACDASILFTTLEGISCAMLECLAAGHPVILSEEANAARVIQPGVTGWTVPTGDLARLADTLHAVISASDDALLGMRAACIATARKYDVAALVARYVDLYETLVPRPSTAAVGV